MYRETSGRVCIRYVNSYFFCVLVFGEIFNFFRFFYINLIVYDMYVLCLYLGKIFIFIKGVENN